MPANWPLISVSFVRMWFCYHVQTCMLYIVQMARMSCVCEDEQILLWSCLHVWVECGWMNLCRCSMNVPDRQRQRWCTASHWFTTWWTCECCLMWLLEVPSDIDINRMKSVRQCLNKRSTPVTHTVMLDMLPSLPVVWPVDPE